MSILKNSFFHRPPLTAASEIKPVLKKFMIFISEYTGALTMLLVLNMLGF